MDEGFRRFAEGCPDSIIVTDREGRIEYVNPACERLTGYAREELAGRSPALLKSGTHDPDFYRRLWAALLAGEEFRAVFRNRRKDGALFYEDKIVRPLQGGFASFGRDVTARALEIERLAHAATHDSLTDLPNRSLYFDRLGQALRHAARRGEQLAVAVMDIDRFRDTNNRYGHPAGDAVLQAVARRSLECVRESDTVARIGGDEFALILTDIGPQALAPVLAKLVAANAAPVELDARELPVSVSIGACSFPDCGATEAELLERADALMYQAKRAGGDRYALPD